MKIYLVTANASSNDQAYAFVQLSFCNNEEEAVGIMFKELVESNYKVNQIKAVDKTEIMKEWVNDANLGNS